MSTAVSASPAAPPDRFAVRLAGVGSVVFLANFGLLVLQLVAGKLLSPFIGSSLETWTSVIAAFLTGIALGNFLGGRMSERRPTAARMAGVLMVGVLATLWMAAMPMLLDATGAHAGIGIDSGRIPLLAFALCLPVATVLSLLTPLAIRFGVPDVARTGRVAGTVFALSSLGCVLGNYLTGFVLIPEMTIDTIVYSVAGLLAVTGVGTLLIGGGTAGDTPAPAPAADPAPAFRPAMPLAVGFAIVFLCSFAGMSLELAASRLMARLVGVSLFTWTGVIGVMLAGTCLGNWAGGRLADRAGRGGTAGAGEARLGACLLAAAAAGVLVMILFAVVSGNVPYAHLGLIGQVLALTFVLFFLPMALLGTVSPQVIRLCVPDVASAGRTAGRVYAVSTAGAILGTFATGYVLISTVGTQGTVLIAAALPAAAVLLIGQVRHRPVTLYVGSAVGGAFLGGAVLVSRGSADLIETNYYTIQVSYEPAPPKFVGRSAAEAAAVGGMPLLKPEVIGSLVLDRLLHSDVNLQDPTYFKYRHEQVQLEAVYAAADRTPADRTPAGQRVLVIGGGGYTFPRATRTLVPSAAVDVVEIDPGVTRAAYEKLELDPKLGIRSFNRDGRQFVAEVAEKGSYDVVSLDAVNDYSVPGHLLTVECNEAVKRTLAPNGAYLVTVIDRTTEGRLWKAAYHTLKRSFKHVYFTLPLGDVEDTRQTAAGSFHAAAKRLGMPTVETHEIVPNDLGRVTAAVRLGRPVASDDEVTEQDIADARRLEYRRTSAAVYREAARRLGRPVVAADDVTREDAVRGLDRVVILLYATDAPLDLDALDATVLKRAGVRSDTYVASDALTRELLGREKELVLTDQYAPVDNLMMGVFLKSERGFAE